MKTLAEAAIVVQRKGIHHELAAWYDDVKASEACMELLQCIYAEKETMPHPLAGVVLALVAGIHIGMEMEKGE